MSKYKISEKLTEAQRDVVFAICNRENQQWPFILNGPPGTGKTVTISETIQTILKMDSTSRILVCTPSNMAADRVAEQLMTDFGDVLTAENVLRLRSPGNAFTDRNKKFDSIVLR